MQRDGERERERERWEREREIEREREKLGYIEREKVNKRASERDGDGHREI